MSGCYFSQQHGYYEGDRISSDDAEVPCRQNPNDTWNGSTWVPDVPKNIEALKAAIRLLEAAQADGMQKAIKQSIISLSETVTAIAAVVGIPAVQAQIPAARALLNSSNQTYARVKALEDSIAPIRSQINTLEGQL